MSRIKAMLEEALENMDNMSDDELEQTFIECGYVPTRYDIGMTQIQKDALERVATRLKEMSPEEFKAKLKEHENGAIAYAFNCCAPDDVK